jgi:hypothetical protein
VAVIISLLLRRLAQSKGVLLTLPDTPELFESIPAKLCMAVLATTRAKHSLIPREKPRPSAGASSYLLSRFHE